MIAGRWLLNPLPFPVVRPGKGILFSENGLKTAVQQPFLGVSEVIFYRII